MEDPNLLKTVFLGTADDGRLIQRPWRRCKDVVVVNLLRIGVQQCEMEAQDCRRGCSCSKYIEDWSPAVWNGSTRL